MYNLHNLGKWNVVAKKSGGENRYHHYLGRQSDGGNYGDFHHRSIRQASGTVITIFTAQMAIALVYLQTSGETSFLCWFVSVWSSGRKIGR